MIALALARITGRDLDPVVAEWKQYLEGHPELLKPAAPMQNTPPGGTG